MGTWRAEISSKITESDLKESRKWKLLRRLGKATRVVRAPSLNYTLIIVEEERLAKYVGKDLGHIHDCFSADIIEEFGVIKLLGSDVYVIEVRFGRLFEALYCILITYQRKECSKFSKWTRDGYNY